MTFRIVADQPEGPKTDTRALPASAAVLAMNWIEEGAESVRIQVDGRSYDLAAFRKQFMRERRRGLILKA